MWYRNGRLMARRLPRIWPPCLRKTRWSWFLPGRSSWEATARSAEWRTAARSTDGRIYPWGTQPAGLSRANFGRTGLSGPVRDRPERLLLYPPIVSVDKYENAVSPYGVFNMAGNVAEWTADWY